MKRLGSSSTDVGAAVAVSSQDEVFVTGEALAGGKDDMFVWQVQTSSPAVLTTFHEGTTGDDGGRGIAVVGDTVYVTGYRSDLTRSAWWKLHYDRATKALSLPAGGGPFTRDLDREEEGLQIAATPAGEVYIVAYAKNASGKWCLYLLKYQDDGTAVWTKSLLSSGARNDHDGGLAISPTGDVYVTGYLSGPVSNPPLSNAGGLDGFLWVIDPAGTGTTVSVNTFGGTGDDSITGVAFNAATGQTYLAGYFRGPADFDFLSNHDLILTTSGGNGAGFLSRLNTAPTASGTTVTTSEDTSLSASVSTSDPDGDTLTHSVVAGPAHGSLTLNNDGTYTYIPAADYNGPDSFTFRANDGTVDSDIGTVSITVTSVNDPPVGVADSFVVNQGHALTASVVANDSDSHGGAPGENNGSLTVELLSGPAHAAAFSLAPDGNFSYSASTIYLGGDAFTYRLLDSLGASAGPVTVIIRVNAPPTALPDGGYSVDEDRTLVGVSTLGNDSDSHGGAPGENNLPLAAQLASGPAHAAAFTLFPDGTFSYAPAADYNGPDSFTSRAVDRLGPASGAGTVSLTVRSVNDPPAAAPDQYGVNEDTKLSGRSVLSNDSDYHGGAPGENNGRLTARLVSGPAHARAFRFNANGTFSYTPAANFNGPDSFTYQAVDALHAASEPATVTITVNPVNDPPKVARLVAVKTTINEPVLIDLRGGVSDVETAPGEMTYAIVRNVPPGTLTPLPGENGVFRYTPPANYIGTATLGYTVTDRGDPDGSNANQLRGAVGTVSVRITQAFSDDFTRAALGGRWAIQVGLPAVNPGRQFFGPAPRNLATANDDNGFGLLLDDVAVSATAVVPAVEGASAGLVARYKGSGDGNYYEAGIVRENGAFLAVIGRRNAAGGERLVTRELSRGRAALAVPLAFTLIGNSLVLLVNRSTLLAAQDAGITGAGGVGIVTQNSPLRANGRGAADSFRVSRATHPGTLSGAPPTSILPSFLDTFTRATLGGSWAASGFAIRSQAAVGQMLRNRATLTGVELADVAVSARLTVPPAAGAEVALVARCAGVGDDDRYEAGISYRGGVFTATITRKQGEPR